MTGGPAFLTPREFLSSGEEAARGLRYQGQTHGAGTRLRSAPIRRHTMSHRLAVSHVLRLLAASAIAAVAVGATPPVPEAQEQETDLRNFRASDVSGTQLQISVDIHSPRPVVVDRARLRLAPVLRGGAVDPTAIEVESLLGPPNAATTTVVVRKRDGASDFVSVAIG
jgi:hypothetical protein